MAAPNEPFAVDTELSPERLVELVLARNPSLAQMIAAWQAASARYPQVISLEDPMFGATLGPATIGSDDVNFAYRLEFSQRLPYPGKRRLRGQSALAEATAAGNNVEDMRLQLIESARVAFYDYYLVHRAIVVNEQSLDLLKQFRDTAEDRVKANQAPQQELRQADVEIGRNRERTLVLERMRKVAIARINTLMHLPPDTRLPPPAAPLDHRLRALQDALRAALPQWTPVTDPAIHLMLEAVRQVEVLPDVQALRASALGRRPDLQALANRISAEEAALALAYKEYHPDFEVMASYDKFMGNADPEMAPMVGIRLNLPVQRDRRAAAVAEAQARIAERRAELDGLSDQVALQVQEAYEQVQESERVVRLYEETILPAAGDNVQLAQAAYAPGRIPFLSLIEAQRNLVELRDRYYEAVAEYHRRRATLERATGLPLSPSVEGKSR